MEEELKPILCMICLNVKRDEDCIVIDESVRNVLDVLLLKLPIEDITNSRICNACCTKAFEAFRFKTLCTDTENSISPYLNSNNGAPIDLKEIYLKKRGKDNLQGTLEIERICRLCMQVATCGFISVKDIDTGLFRTYIPEVNFIASKEPVICTDCLESLKRHTDFLGNCLGVQKFDSVYENEETEGQFYITTKKIEIKSEEDFEYTETSLSADQATDSKCQDDNKPKSQPFETQTKIECSTPDYQSNKDSYKCDICDYETKEKRRFSEHQLKHKDVSEVIMYKCDVCSFQTKHRRSLAGHGLRHKDISEVQMHECDKCDFKTRHKNSLVNHQMVHEDISQMQMYKCDLCSYQAKRKGQLKLHQLRHKNTSRLQTYKYDQCDYENGHKESLKKHGAVHRDISEMHIYKCDACSYQAKRKGQLKLHQLLHKEASQVHMYKCDACSYESRYNKNLIRHKLKHQDSSEVKMYKCDACSFETKYKHSFNAHQQRHQVTSKGQLQNTINNYKSA